MSRPSAILITVVGLTVFLGTVCAAQQGGPSNTPIPANAAVQSSVTSADQSINAPRLSERYPRYRISPSDQFDIVFEFSPEFNQTVIVQPDGFINLKDVGDIHIAGETVPVATEHVRTAYEKILANPSISIVLRDFNRPYFIVNGEVGKPGKYELRADTTVTEGVGIAGGFLSSAKHSQVLLFRRVSDEWVQAKIINVKKMVKNGKLTEDLHLQPGDMLYVPKNAMSKIETFIPRSALSAYTTPIP